MSQLPTGIVTFLFTDIEGSTRKWQNYPHQMKVALERHDELLQKAIDDNNGWVFKTVGDAFCAAFHRAIDCVNACIDAQIAVNKETWDIPEPIKVRMSVHTGEAVERNNDYYGPTLNRVARLEAITYGQQVLISTVTADLLKDMLPAPIEIKFMGEHRLKDLIRPEGVYQLIHPELPDDFPPIQSLDAHPHNLKVQPNVLIGREKELKELTEILMDRSLRALTICGTGGLGKTRIALQLAAEMIEKFRDGVFFIDLTRITSEDSLYNLIIETLSIKDSGEIKEIELLESCFKKKEILLLLDNFEHVTKKAVDVAEILGECAGLHILITSREALHIRGEKVYRLPPMKLPIKKDPTIKNLISLDELKNLEEIESTRLLLDRAREGDNNFKLSRENAPYIMEICIRLNGIPLAIELAAARISALSPQVLLKKLSNSLETLNNGSVDLPDRQQTLRSTIDWSFNLLEPEMKKLYSLMAIFTGGFDLETAEDVAKSYSEIDITDGITSLLDKSLLSKTVKESGIPWYYMLESILEFAGEQLDKLPEKDKIRDQWGNYLLRLADEGNKKIQTKDQEIWMETFTLHKENFDKTLAWYARNKKINELADLSSNLGTYWQYKGLYKLGIRYYRLILSKKKMDESFYNQLRINLGRLLKDSGQLEGSRAVLEDVLNSNETDRFILMNAQKELANTFYCMNEFEKSQELDSYVIAEGDPLLKAKAEASKGLCLWRQKKLNDAEILFKRSYKYLYQYGDPRSIGNAADNLGIIFYQKGNYQQSEFYLLKAIHIFRKIGEKNFLRNALNNLAYLYLQDKKFSLSLKINYELISLVQPSHDKYYLSTAYSGLAEAYLGEDEIERSLTWVERAKDLVKEEIDSIEYGISLRILADISFRNGLLDKSEKIYKQCLPILEKNKEMEEVERVKEALLKLEES